MSSTDSSSYASGDFSGFRTENNARSIVSFSSGLAILIACMGIFGLTAMTVNRRTKEIGIRKVLGANVPQIVFILTSEFLILAGMANVFGWPLAYWAVRTFLNNCHFRISRGIHYFL